MICIQIILVIRSVCCIHFIHFIHFIHIGVFWIICFNFVLEKQKQ